MTWLKGRINANFIFVVRQCVQLPLRQAKSPSFLIVGRAIRNPIGGFRQSEQVLAELRKTHFLSYRNAVVHNVQIASSEIDNSCAAAVLDVSVTNVPFLRHNPVEN